MGCWAWLDEGSQSGLERREKKIEKKKVRKIIEKEREERESVREEREIKKEEKDDRDQGGGREESVWVLQCHVTI